MKLILFLRNEERNRIHKHLLNENYFTLSICGIVIIIFQLIMLMMNYASGSTSMKTILYRYHYMVLIAITLIAEILIYIFKKSDKTLSLFYFTMGIYMFLVYLWGSAITYIGFGHSQDLSTYAYVVIATSAIILLEPWAVFINVATSNTVLYWMLIRNPMMQGVDMGTIIQLTSIGALSLVVSIVSFNRRLLRVRLEFDQKQSLQEIQYLNRQLQRDADCDGLTGLYNRHFLTQHIDDPLKVGDEASTGILMIDIDYFKQINDTYGHQAGDEVLTYLGGEIRSLVRDEDSYAVRYGGEEFLVYYELITKDELVALATKLCDEVRSHTLVSGGQMIQFTLSVGFALA
ncbi:MAG: diguanylate cyclase, partial [Erysipelotrichaceae bacterium]|nr:diguanylate cyclase [Erysipelotrichaceae bacterium]